ncbi:MAG: uroporphyrinogen-III C-methyltransferase [Frankiaceae bacterium]|nr:uroporphyrinogen-III C-methyltransferase [Arenimonas sp.]
MSLPVPDPSPPISPRRLPAALWALLGIAALVAALLGWRAFTTQNATREAAVDLRPEALDARLLQVEAEITSLRRSQESLNQKLTDTRARTGLLRDEVLASTQRSSLLEDSVRDLSSVRRDGVAVLRLDEVELLLTLAQQRLRLAGDLSGAIRATELAEGVLTSQSDPALLDLRQTIAQELAALHALPANPAAQAAGELDALEAVLPKLDAGAVVSADPGNDDGNIKRLIDSLVQVRRSGDQDLLSPADRETGKAALGLDLALARSALAQSDEPAFRRSLVHVDNWLQRLYPDTPLLRERRARIKRLGSLALGYNLPIAGSTLQQLQDLQRSRRVSR